MDLLMDVGAVNFDEGDEKRDEKSHEKNHFCPTENEEDKIAKILQGQKILFKVGSFKDGAITFSEATTVAETDEESKIIKKALISNFDIGKIIILRPKQ